MHTRPVCTLRHDVEEVRLRLRIRSSGALPLSYKGAGVRDNLGDLAAYEGTKIAFGQAGLGAVRTPHSRRETRLEILALSGSKYFRGLVLGGGTLINDYWLDEVAESSNRLAQSFAFGTGVGSSGFDQSSDFLLNDRWREVLSRFSIVGVRGPLSAQRLIGAGIPNVRIVGDAALGYASIFEPHLVPQRAYFLLNVTGSPNQTPSDSKWIRRAVLAAAQAYLESGLEACPVALTPSDLEPTSEVIRELGLSTRVFCPRTPLQFLDLSQRCAVGIGVRLHASVLSAVAGTPVLAISYRDKAHDFTESMAPCSLAISEGSTDGLIHARAAELVRSAQEQGRVLRKQSELYAQKQAQMAREMFRALL